MSQPPNEPHPSDAELRERCEAERLGLAFLLYRDHADAQRIYTLEDSSYRKVLIGRISGPTSPSHGTKRFRARMPSSSGSVTTGHFGRRPLTQRNLSERRAPTGAQQAARRRSDSNRRDHRALPPASDRLP